MLINNQLFPKAPVIKGISACLIVKNEQQRLPECLESLTLLVDEIVVVDTGSTDRTVEIAKKYQARVFEFAWCDDFSQARNYAIAQATGTWILIIDADEVLEAEALATLQNVVQRDNCLAVNLLRSEIGATQSPYSLVLRLFRNHPEVHFEGIYHESIDQSVQSLQQREPQWQIVNVEIPTLRHYGYTTGEIARKNKFEFASRLMQKHLDSFPDDIYMLNKLGALYISADRNEQLSMGMQLLHRGLKLSELNDHENHYLVRYELHYHLGLAYEFSNDWELSKGNYEQAIALDIPELIKIGAYLNLGNLYHDERIGNQAEQSQQAIAYYQKVIEIMPSIAQAHCNLGLAYKKVGYFDKAIKAYTDAISFAPDYAEAHQNLGSIFLKIGRFNFAVSHLQKAIILYEQQQNQQMAQYLRSNLRDLGIACQ
ncbi:glycosyltransferase [Pseudanabaena biceps]|nr:glycosyltransferase [Pseudanabaena biceps]